MPFLEISILSLLFIYKFKIQKKTDTLNLQNKEICKYNFLKKKSDVIPNKINKMSWHCYYSLKSRTFNYYG